MELTFYNKAVLFGFLLTASSSIVLAAQAPVSDVNSTSNTDQTPISLSEQLSNIERKLDSRNRAQVNIQRQLDDLQTQVNELRGITELHTHQLSQVIKRQRELYQELDRRVSEAVKPANNTTNSIAKNQNVSSSPVANSSNTSTDYSNDLTENEAYDKALNLVLKDKQYEQAIPEFRRFNRAYPQSTYAANSHYWLGQLLFNKGQLSDAEQEFSIVVQRFKDSSKRPDALLKLAMVSQQQNNINKAKQLYQQLLKEYPNSTSAQLAKPRFDKL